MLYTRKVRPFHFSLSLFFCFSTNLPSIPLKQLRMTRVKVFFVFLQLAISPIVANWSSWWTYSGISGPSYWGLIGSPEWTLCSVGRRQSPINVEAKSLVYDGGLSDVKLEEGVVKGVLENTGQSLVFRVGKGAEANVNVTGGPLAYK